MAGKRLIYLFIIDHGDNYKNVWGTSISFIDCTNFAFTTVFRITLQYIDLQ